MPTLEREIELEVLVLCIVCDEPLDHLEDLWCPGCEEVDAEAEAGEPGGRRARPTASV